jgi:hypothetical protein
MASIQIVGNDKLQVLADLIYLARHSPSGLRNAVELSGFSGRRQK